MIPRQTPEALPREPGPIARSVVYVFVATAPVLVLITALLPAAIVTRLGGGAARIALAVGVLAVYAALLAASFRRIRALASRFTPPLALPGDIWNIGVANPPKRSSNWPIRLRLRRPAPGGTRAPARRLAA
jgi:hypothetical protein